MADSLDLLEDEETLDLGSIGEAVDESIEMNYQFSLLNLMGMNVSIASELDGQYDEIVTEPELAIEKAGLNLYTCMTSGFFHRVRVEAADAGQFYHVRFCEATMHYQGQLAS